MDKAQASVRHGMSASEDDDFAPARPRPAKVSSRQGGDAAEQTKPGGVHTGIVEKVKPHPLSTRPSKATPSCCLPLLPRDTLSLSDSDGGHNLPLSPQHPPPAPATQTCSLQERKRGRPPTEKAERPPKLKRGADGQSKPKKSLRCDTEEDSPVRASAAGRQLDGKGEPSTGAAPKKAAVADAPKKATAAAGTSAAPGQRSSKVPLKRECEREACGTTAGSSAIDGGDFKENQGKQVPCITTRHFQSGERAFVCKIINTSSGVKRLMDWLQGRPLLAWRIAFKHVGADDESDDDDELADPQFAEDLPPLGSCDISVDRTGAEKDEQVVGMGVAYTGETCWFVSSSAFRTHSDFWGVVAQILTRGDALKVTLIDDLSPSPCHCCVPLCLSRSSPLSALCVCEGGYNVPRR